MEGVGVRVPTEKKASYICDLRRHFFRDCPLKVTKPVKDEKDANKVDKVITCGTLGRHTNEAYLEIEVNGRFYNCLLDTGSDVTIFPYTMVKGYKLHPSTTHLKAPNGSPIPLLGKTTVKAVWKARTIKLQGVVTEHMDEVILGLTWLQEQGAVCDFKTGHQPIEGEKHLQSDGEDAMICLRLVVQESIVIPARCQLDMPTKTVYRNLKATRDSAGTSWMTESGDTVHGLQIPRTLVLNRLLEVSVRVMNVQDHPVTWKKGNTVSNLEQVDVMTPTTEEIRQAPDLTFKVDVIAAVDEEIQPAEKGALSLILDESFHEENTTLDLRILPSTRSTREITSRTDSRYEDINCRTFRRLQSRRQRC